MKAIFNATHDRRGFYFLHDGEAIAAFRSKYFKHYKIKLGHIGRNLRESLEKRFFVSLFCKTFGDTSRPRAAAINVQDITVADLFDRYIQKCDDIICGKLNAPTGCAIVREKLLALARIFWESNRISVPKNEAIKILDNKDPSEIRVRESWTFGIRGEGLLVDLNWRNGTDVIEFAHQSIGEYLMAISLIDGKSENDLASLLQEKSTHPRFTDVLQWVAFLLPIKYNKHLFEVVPSSEAVDAAQQAVLFELPPKFINDESVVWLTKRLATVSLDVRRTIINGFYSIAAIQNHILNANFFDEILQKMPMPERDIVWTEWVRYHADTVNTRIDFFEAQCKRGSGTLDGDDNEKLILTAKLIMWCLTSTSRELRDRTTKALYCFGRRNPQTLFAMTENSLKINDPYVPERMLAASYGTAMAIHQLKFAVDDLAIFAKKLYELMFKKGTLYSTTHLLMRDYARNIIEVALLNQPNLLTVKERKRLIQPFKDGGIRKWCKSKDRNEKEYRNGNYPFGTDFDNYTIGYLIPNRRNYDFKDPEYIQVKSNIWWRIYQLGYSLDLFGSIDSVIANERWQFGRESDGGKIDRYGKKYCWIAWYEIAGFRNDKGLLKQKWEEDDRQRKFEDIDPSFPDQVQEIEIVKTDFLGKRAGNLPNWIEKGPVPDIKPYLILEEIQGDKGPWVLLDGYIAQEDLDARRGVFIFSRGLLVKKAEASNIMECLNKQDLGGRWLPEIQEYYSLFAGEIPWNSSFKRNGGEYLNFVTEEQIEKIPFKDIISNSDKYKLSHSEILQVVEYETERQQRRKTKKVFLERRKSKTKEYAVSLPVHTFSWEGRNKVNHSQHAYIPSKELCEALELSSRPQTFDFFDGNDEKASVSLRYGEAWHTMHKLIYIRQDLIEKYLNDKKLDLIWAIWGEREFKPKENVGLHEFAEKHQAYKVFQTVASYRTLVK